MAFLAWPVWGGGSARDLASMKFVLAAYSAVYDHCRLLDLDVATHPWLTFFGLLFGLDFLYYWFHRVVHEYHTLWALDPGHCWCWPPRHSGVPPKPELREKHLGDRCRRP